MVSFPQVKRIEVTGYELYPGKDKIYLTQIPFDDGPWMILGVNGLGKSTLLMLLRFLLTGPYNTPSPGFKGEKTKPYFKYGEATFSARVSDNARDAFATLNFVIGSAHFSVRRSLNNLSLDRAEIKIDGIRTITESEDDLQGIICKSVGVTEFSDYIKIITWLLFYLDAKTPLIWDVNAQYEIFKSILIPKVSNRMRILEGAIVTADSSIRNIADAIRKIKDRESKELKKLASVPDTLKELERMSSEKSKLSEDLESALIKLKADEEREKDSETMFKRAELDLEDAQIKYEYRKIVELQSELEKYDNNTKYLIVKILTDSSCVFCGVKDESLSALVESRVSSGKCISCGENISISNKSEITDGSVNDVISHLEECKSKYSNFVLSYKDAKEKLSNTRKNVVSLRERIDLLDARLRKLTSNLPSQERGVLAGQESRLSLLEDQLEPFREDKKNAEDEIVSLVSQLKSEAEKVKDKIINAFQQRANIFFAEKIKLVYAPRTTKIGQGAGRSIELPAFEVEMTSGATKDEFMRRKSAEVSLSQRDYIDLIFRMSLIESLSDSGGSLVIDGPEGAVDAVFASRAGFLINNFSNNKNINTISACNIVDGDFIPSVLSNFSTKEARNKHVVDLMEIAVPTAAVRNLMGEYRSKLQKIIGMEI